MNLESLRYFVALENHSTYVKAAESLYITSQGLGKAISGLEAEVGAPLIGRDSRGISFTRYGLMFLDTAKRILAMYDDTVEKITLKAASTNTAISKPLNLITEYIVQASTLSMASTKILEGFRVHECSIRDVYSTLKREGGQALATCALEEDELAWINQRGEFIFEEIRTSYVGYLANMAQISDNAGIEEIAQTVSLVYANPFLDDIYAKLETPYPEDKIAVKSSSWNMIMECILKQERTAIADSFSFITHSMYNPTKMSRMRFVPILQNQARFHVGYLYYSKSELNQRLRTLIDETIVAYNEFCEFSKFEPYGL